MKPQVAVDITARDKTDAGFAKAEARAEKYGKHLVRTGDKYGLGKLGEAVRGLSKIAKLEFSGEGVAKLGAMSRVANENVGGLTRGVLSLGVSGPGAFGAVAEGAGALAGATAGAAAAVVGLGVAVYSLGDKWARTGAEIGRTSKTLAVSSDWLQATRAASERFGVTTDQTTASVEALGSTLYDAKYGANNQALGAMTQLGVKLKTTKDGAIDVAAAFDDISDAVARQKDPLVQRKVAQLFGLQGMLPAIRQGSASLKAEGKDYLGSGAEISADQVGEAEPDEGKFVRMRQHLGALEKKAGMAAMGVAALAADRGVGALHAAEGAPGKAWAGVQGVAKDLGHAGAEAGRKLVEGGREAGHVIGTEFERFVGRIEHQESRGHQFDRRGNPLTSSAGAVGDMQLLPESARIEAKRAGIAWDPTRFRTDQAYNRQIGAAYLARLTAKYGGDEVLAAAAYNAGEGRIDGFHKNGKYVPGWLQTIGDPRTGKITDADFISKIPFEETRNYAAATAKAHVTVDFKNLPSGASVRAATDSGVSIDLGVHRALEGAP